MPLPHLTCAILTHRDRLAMATRLAVQLGRLDPTVVIDETHTHGNLPAALTAWSQAATSGYHLVIQDDAQPVPGFVSSAGKALRVADGAAVAFWMRPWHPDATTHRRADYSTLIRVRTHREWPPSVALALPSEEIIPFIDHAAECHQDSAFDDEVLGCYLEHAGVPLLACSPSIVGHDAEATSILNGRRKRRLFRGEDYLAEQAPSSWSLA